MGWIRRFLAGGVAAPADPWDEPLINGAPNDADKVIRTGAETNARSSRRTRGSADCGGNKATTDSGSSALRCGRPRSVEPHLFALPQRAAPNPSLLGASPSS